MATPQTVRQSKQLTLVGLVAALVGPLTGFLGTLLALAIAAVLLQRGERREAALLAGLAILAVAILLLFLTPVNTGTRFVNG